jgi:Uma2 family endonuclease
MSDASPLMTAEEFCRRYGGKSVELVEGRLMLSGVYLQEVNPRRTILSPQTTPALITGEEFARRCADQRVELVKGVVKELPIPSPRRGKICAAATYLLSDFALQHDLGHVMSNDSYVRTSTSPETIRGADVCFYGYERLPKGEVPDGLLPVAPDLVVEVRSRNDTWSDIFAKISEYLGAGVRAVVILDDASQTASVYRQEEFQRIFTNGDELTVPEILPGFSVAVARLFA